jgi:hypothetical protein
VLQPPEPPSDERLQEYTRYFRYLSRPTYADTEANGVIIAGAPETVVWRLREIFALTQLDASVGVFSFGGVSHQEVCRSLRLFAQEVLAALR